MSLKVLGAGHFDLLSQERQEAFFEMGKHYPFTQEQIEKKALYIRNILKNG